jgi:hypothetical protein
MKFLCRALCVLFIAVSAVRAAQDEESPLGDFAPLDDDLVLYIPKFAVKLGVRGLSGAKTAFGGQAKMFSTTELDGPTGVAARRYHDGYVGLDSRTVTDPSGVAVPIAPDGKTNTWSFLEQSQGTDDGLIAMHAYSVSTNDANFRSKDIGSAFGVEISLDREFGSLRGSKVKWGVVGGVSINQIYATTTGALDGNVTTITDKYSLGGQAAPTAPFTSPSFTGAVDTNTLLGNELLERTTTTAATTAAISNIWKVRGAYLTFRAGPYLYYPITEKFSAQVSAGAVLVYAGSTYDVTQSFKPQTGDVITQDFRDGDSTVLPGYFVDASLMYAMTDTAGLYVGAVYQSSGDYSQDVESSDGNSKYTTRVDLSKLKGIRAGVSFKF